MKKPNAVFTYLKNTSNHAKLFVYYSRKKLRGAITHLSKALSTTLFDFIYIYQDISLLNCLDKKKPIIIFHPIIDWNIPLFQRPQHIAISLAKLGYQYIFCTPGTYDTNKSFFQPIPNLSLYVIRNYELVKNKILANPEFEKKIFHFYAQDHRVSQDDIAWLKNNNSQLLCEYIDAITDELSIGKDKIQQRHRAVLNDEHITLVGTADNLIHEVTQIRTKNYKKITNGVEFSHFSKYVANETSLLNFPQELADFISPGNKVVGYFGAIASWFDYSAILHLSVSRPHYKILLLGWDYDGSLSKYPTLKHRKNIKILGPIHYKKLPDYAAFFDIGIIPFVLNEITLATNPIKLFEYMALGKPIVCANLPECRHYKSALLYNDHTDFIKQVDIALTLCNSPEYLSILKEEALQNTWDSKAREIAALFNSN